MAGAGSERSTEHDEADRTAFAVMLVLLGLVGSFLALGHRQTISRASGPGDACPVEAHGGLVGLDAETGAVRWTNVVPDGGRLEQDEATGEVRFIRAANDGDDPERSLVIERTVDPGTGRITACTTERSGLQVAEHNQRIAGDDPVDPPLVDGDVTVMKWGSGLRATDPINTGIWSLEQARADYRVGGDLIVDEYTADGSANRTSRIDLRTGEPRWTVDGTLTNTGPGHGTLVINSWARPDQLSSVDPETGEVGWTTKVPFFDDEEKDGVVVAFDLGELVLVPDGDDGKVAAIDAAAGDVRWTATAGTPGRNRKWSLPGDAASAALSADGKTVIVVVDAWMPEQYD